MIELEDILSAAAAKVRDQSERVANELTSTADAVTSAKAIYEEAMKRVVKMRADADELQREAQRAFDQNLTQAMAIMISIETQLRNGHVYTGQQVDSQPHLRGATQENVKVLHGRQ